jgi:3-oxoacyl-[acyl-carrier-protein] synthase II
MGRFIQFAIAAAEFAVSGARLKIDPDPDQAERAGVYIGSGIGGFEVIEREHKNLLEKGPGRISPFFIPATIVNLASGRVPIRPRPRPAPPARTASAIPTV